MKTPYLIQRCKIKNVKDAEITGLDALLSYDYMGAAEFEFGALGQSAKRITANLSTYTIATTGLKDLTGKGLFSVCPKKDQAEVRGYACQLAEDGLVERTIRTKEHVGLKTALTGVSLFGKPADEWQMFHVWWDIQNDYFLVLGKPQAKLIMTALSRLQARWLKEGKIQVAA